MNAKMQAQIDAWERAGDLASIMSLKASTTAQRRDPQLLGALEQAEARVRSTTAETANAIAAEANRHARKANQISILSAIIAVAALVASVIALWK